VDAQASVEIEQSYVFDYTLNDAETAPLTSCSFGETLELRFGDDALGIGGSGRDMVMAGFPLAMDRFSANNFSFIDRGDDTVIWNLFDELTQEEWSGTQSGSRAEVAFTYDGPNADPNCSAEGFCCVGDRAFCLDIVMNNDSFDRFEPTYPPADDNFGTDTLLARIRWNGEASENFSARRSSAKILIQCAFLELRAPTSP